jgi:Uma2 family endonuclease
MGTSLPSLKLTYEDYLYLPEDGKRHELIDGEHYVTPAPTLKHQAIVANLVFYLKGLVRDRRLGRLWPSPVDVILSEVDVVQPDVVFVSSARQAIAIDANVQGAPDLVIEILSPGTRRTDLVTKRHLYEKHGVLEYWVIDPELETVQVHRLIAGRYERRELEGDATLESDLLPGSSLPLAEIFA